MFQISKKNRYDELLTANYNNNEGNDYADTTVDVYAAVGGSE